MIKNISIQVLFFFILSGAFAQDKLPSLKFHSINQVGLLNGENHTAFQLQSVNGFEYKGWFAGVGVGLDYYQNRSIPVFAELRKYFGSNKNKFFVYADAGLHFIWEKKDDPYVVAARYYPRFYGNAGFGYLVPFKNGTGFLLSAGYSYKKVTYKRDIYNFCPFDGPCFMHTETYNYDFNRLVVQIGLMF